MSAKCTGAGRTPYGIRMVDYDLGGTPFDRGAHFVGANRRVCPQTYLLEAGENEQIKQQGDGLIFSDLWPNLMQSFTCIM